MVSRFLDWLDESAAGVIRVAYLLAGVIAVASYFSDGRVPSGLARLLDNALPWVLAGALEIHTYLTARRVRSAYQDIQAATLGSDEHDKAEGALRVNLWILAGLLAFSCYNQLQYLAATWTPPRTPLTPPGPFPYLIRALITPSAFMAAAFLAPMGEGMAVQLQREAHRLSHLAFKAASAQWKRRLREMQRRNQDITAALVALVDDPTERRVIASIHAAMHPDASASSSSAIAETEVATLPPPLEVAAPVAPQGPTRPPTGPGSPTARPRELGTASAATARHTAPAVVSLEARRGQGAARSNTPRRKVAAKASAEAKVRRAWRPDMSVSQLERAAGVSRSTAAKWHKVLTVEAASSSSAGDLAQ